MICEVKFEQNVFEWLEFVVLSIHAMNLIIHSDG